MSADFTPEKEDYKILTPFKMQVLTNFPYIEADFDALTNYQLLCKVVEYLNNVIHNENEVTEQITSLYNAYVALQNYVNNTYDTLSGEFSDLENYVNNYFENLDVQTEINNKLDEMATDGTLANIIENYTSLPEIEALLTNTGIPRIDATGTFLTNQSSWVGYKNTKYLSDNATRFYLIPKDHVTTGVGGCLKIFADDYFNNQDYRDLGIYFSADQNNDKGYYNNGVNWINVKVLDNGSYANKHPDLGFSFQDGHVVAGRITCFNNSRAEWVFGPGLPVLGGVDLAAEFQKSVGLTKGSRIRFEKNRSSDQYNDLFSNDDGELTFSINSKENVYVGGQLVEERTANNVDIKKALITTARTNVTGTVSTINATGTNRIVLGDTNSSTITSITGTDGQEITIICALPGTTIQNTSSIHLLNAADYTMNLNSTLTLINVNGTWYEKCRSVNFSS